MPDFIYLSNLTKITRSDALDTVGNILVENAQFLSFQHLCMGMWKQKDAVSTVVAAHLGVRPERMDMPYYNLWKYGSFNVVVPLTVKPADAAAHDAQTQTVLLRVPKPARTSEEQYPGSVADKLRCEVASYILMQQHCPEVRIPHLYGFSIPGADGGQFMHASQLSIFRRAVLHIRQLVASWLGRPVPSMYLRTTLPAAAHDLLPPPLADTGYLILEYLSPDTFGQHPPYIMPHDRPLHTLYAEQPTKTRNLCRGIARTMLALARIPLPQPRIGAFRFCLADGTIRLDGRPATCSMAILEAAGAPRTMALDTTYTRAGDYVLDLARFQETSFRVGAHTGGTRKYSERQMAAMVAMRATAHHFVDLGSGPQADNGGPFILQLSDLNAGNMLIDDDWNVTAIFDLEWLYAAPVAEMLPPSWLTWKGTVDTTGDGFDEYSASCKVFMDVLADEERTMTGSAEAPLSEAMTASWTSHRVWFYLALNTIDCMEPVFRHRLKPLFFTAAAAAEETAKEKAETTTTEAETHSEADSDSDSETVSPLPSEALYQLWHPGAHALVEQKLRDREQYEAAVVRLFDAK